MYNNYEKFASPSVMIEERGREWLIERRAKAKAVTTYKILNQFIDILRERLNQFGINHTRSQAALYVPYCHTDIYKYSCFQVQHNCGTICLFT